MYSDHDVHISLLGENNIDTNIIHHPIWDDIDYYNREYLRDVREFSSDLYNAFIVSILISIFICLVAGVEIDLNKFFYNTKKEQI